MHDTISPQIYPVRHNWNMLPNPRCWLHFDIPPCIFCHFVFQNIGRVRNRAYNFGILCILQRVYVSFFTPNAVNQRQRFLLSVGFTLLCVYLMIKNNYLALEMMENMQDLHRIYHTALADNSTRIHFVITVIRYCLISKRCKNNGLFH